MQSNEGGGEKSFFFLDAGLLGMQYLHPPSPSLKHPLLEMTSPRYPARGGKKAMKLCAPKAAQSKSMRNGERKVPDQPRPSREVTGEGNANPSLNEPLSSRHQSAHPPYLGEKLAERLLFAESARKAS